MTKTVDVSQCGPWCPCETLHPGLEGMVGPPGNPFLRSHFLSGSVMTVEPACAKMRIETMQQAVQF